ncbi:MAG: hypothetical protein N3A66_10350 [Planctomycetota bacterium]|nr:hypothetical protein [Planctomycetota bacterium]
MTARIPKPFSTGPRLNQRCAIISDIPGNLVAPEAVLRLSLIHI